MAVCDMHMKANKMANETMVVENRRGRVKPYLKKRFRYFILAGVMLGIAMTGYFGSIIFQEDLVGYGMNILTELLGVLLSVVIAVFFVDRMNARNQIAELKRRLIREARSQANDTAISAVEEMRARGWLCDDKGLLMGANLHKANLQYVNLNSANMAGARLMAAKLRQASMERVRLTGAELGVADLEAAEMSLANMEEASLIHANLSGAILFEANMRRTNLHGAILQGALLINSDFREAKLLSARLHCACLNGVNLNGADLTGAVLLGASLSGATLRTANLTDAIMPDGTKHIADSDLGRFTDEDHPEFEETSIKIVAIAKAQPRQVMPNIHVSFPVD